MGLKTNLTEKDLLDKYPDERIEIPLYFYLDDKGFVVIDEESMRDEFENHIKDFYEVS